jgi:hypothetical protein
MPSSPSHQSSSIPVGLAKKNKAARRKTRKGRNRAVIRKDIGEREAISIHEGRIAAVYATEFAAIQSQIPNGVPRERWHLFINDAGNFLDAWSDLAERLGWTAEDLFGIHPNAPLARNDDMGLIWLLKGQTVTGLDEETADLSGGLKYRRRHSR